MFRYPDSSWKGLVCFVGKTEEVVPFFEVDAEDLKSSKFLLYGDLGDAQGWYIGGPLAQKITRLFFRVCWQHSDKFR